MLAACSGTPLAPRAAKLCSPLAASPLSLCASLGPAKGLLSFPPHLTYLVTEERVVGSMPYMEKRLSSTCARIPWGLPSCSSTDLHLSADRGKAHFPVLQAIHPYVMPNLPNLELCNNPIALAPMASSGHPHPELENMQRTVWVLTLNSQGRMWGSSVSQAEGEILELKPGTRPTFILISLANFSSSFLTSVRIILDTLRTSCFHSMGWKLCGSCGTYNPILTFLTECKYFL